MKGFMHFIAKNYLWPETGTRGGLIDHTECWRCKTLKTHRWLNI